MLLLCYQEFGLSTLAEIKSKSIRAFKWNVISQLLNQSLVLCVNIILVRLMSPSDFGLMALPMVAYSFFRMVQDLGYSDVMIKEKNADQPLLSSIYWMIVIGGVVVAIINYGISPLVGRWAGDATSMKINQWMALIILIGSFSIGLEGMMKKILDFKALFWAEFLANLLSGIVAIYLAYTSWSWIALVARLCIFVTVQLLINVLLSTWRPSFIFDIHRLSRHLTFASQNIGDQILNFLQRNIDTVLIARYIGSNALGIYDRSYKLLLLPLQQVSGTFSKVMFPAFSSIGDEKERVARHYLTIVKLISLVTFPMMLGLLAVCEDFVTVVFGQQWLGMVEVLQLFSVVAIFQSISTISGSIFVATDNMSTLFRYSIFAKPLTILAIFLAVWIHRDIYHVALYTVIISTILLFPLWHLLSKSLGIRVIEIWKALLPQLILSVLMCSSIYFMVLRMHKSGFTPMYCLIGGTVLGSFIYLMGLLITKNQALQLAIELWKNMLKKDDSSNL